MADRREPYNPLLKSYPDSEKVNAVSLGAETMFTRLLAQSDDRARYFADPRMLLGKLYTHRMANGEVSESDMVVWRDDLHRKGLISIYTAADERKYIEITNCKKSIRNDLKPDIRFPDPVRYDSVTDSARQPNPTQPNPTQSGLSPLSAFADDAVRGEDFLPDGFAAWWKAWPRHHRKQGRAKCLRFWKTHRLERISDRVIDALGRSKNSPDWTKQDGEFVPMPMSWLNKTPWETDPDDFSQGKDHGNNNGPSLPKFGSRRANQPAEHRADADPDPREGTGTDG